MGRTLGPDTWARHLGQTLGPNTWAGHLGRGVGRPHGRTSGPGKFAGQDGKAGLIVARSAWRQWLVPAEKVILLYTLYLPTGLLMGMRLSTLKVAASTTSTAPSFSQTEMRARLP